MPLFKHKAKILFFAHIPKTGGSTIEHGLRNAGAKRALYSPNRADYLRCTMQHMHAELYQIFVPKGFYQYSLCVVRHPFDRLVSEYKWRLKLKQTKKTFDHWLNTSFDRYEENPYVLDNHLRPQVEFIAPHVEVFKLEDGLDKAFKAAADHLRLEVSLDDHRNKGPKADVDWSPKTRDRAIAFYFEDFKQLDYNSEDSKI